MRLIEKVWFQGHPAKWLIVPLLLPLSVLFAVLSFLRRLAYQVGLFKQVKMSVPVVVVGNIGIGGNGKTPVTLCLVEKLTEQGIKIGVVSRGYGSKAPHYPYQVTDESSAETAGDEPLLIFQRSGVPVVIGADRIKACQCLIELGCEIIIADDGLQHYRLARDFEFVVIDGKRLFGNGLLLPAGPLRETTSRIARADCVIVNGLSTWQKQASAFALPILTMVLKANQVINVKSGKSVDLDIFLAQNLAMNKRINAIAGIGDPQRFFNTLEQVGFILSSVQGFIDHQAFSAHDLAPFSGEIPLLMTEKDAVKCASFAQEYYWYLPVDAEFTPNTNGDSIATIITKIAGLVNIHHL
ncbi:tetraacyldisaccharide 4'-kinase [Cognaticolwellia beringensis]|uniref:Tetraacyldisaccharide 4'-kinase n=1 Tax=Cognaticolwellia beringensis TaxID=1967665 RepID=A0A222GAR7_9GAMM|nr:tetraacyldisaccharide 4'-kinase [Cognaticolwellia beringensis]ASP48881.1 tetraacyldisaccharide 4'-kinase [Cognaticolwellia beringensis]